MGGKILLSTIFVPEGEGAFYDAGLVTECTLFYSLNRNSVFQTEVRHVSELSCTYSVYVDMAIGTPRLGFVGCI